MPNGKNDPRIPHTNQRTAICKLLKTNYLVEAAGVGLCTGIENT